MTKHEAISKAGEFRFWSFGTSRIFERRANRLKKLRTIITFLGIITPVFVGGIVLSFGVESKVLPFFIFIASIIGLIQLSLSTWAIVARWDEQYEYSIDSMRDNTDIFNQSRDLIENTPEDYIDCINELKRQYELRERTDLSQNIKDSEKRFANREALRYFKQSCHICENTPQSSTPSNCDGCGNFSTRWYSL